MSKDNNSLSSEEMDQLIEAYHQRPEMQQFPRAAVAFYLQSIYDIVMKNSDDKGWAGPRMGALKLWGDALELTRAHRAGDSDETGISRSTPEFLVKKLAQEHSLIPKSPGK